MSMKTKTLSVSAQDADSNSTGNRFEWKWWLKDIKQDKDVNVFSCFSCGGGSTMGYKRAGFQVLGNVEIDPRMNKTYLKNQHPKYNFNMDLRDFNKLDNLPDELYHLDILDGSPPCSTFSTAGEREKAWGKKKVFREGQKKQTLDDLFFVFLDTVEKLSPKIVVAENVTGILKGNAKGYVNEIIKRFHDAGYVVQIFRLNAALMNVPQTRERVFFVANNQNYPKLKLGFNERPILFGEVRSEKGKQFQNQNSVYKELLEHRNKNDTCIADISKRIRGKESGYNSCINQDGKVAYTLISGGCAFRGCDGLNMSDEDCRNIQTFPQDYNFGNEDAKYICGMSVPPNMMANIAFEMWKQWIEPTKAIEKN